MASKLQTSSLIANEEYATNSANINSGVLVPLSLVGALICFAFFYIVFVFIACLRRGRHKRKEDEPPTTIPLTPLSPGFVEKKLDDYTSTMNEYPTFLDKYLNDDAKRLSNVDSILSKSKSYTQPSFKRPDKFNRTMGLRKLDRENWLTIERELYHDYWGVRTELLDNMKHEVLQYDATNPQVQDACKELLALVVEYFPQKYPSVFGIFVDPSGHRSIHNKVSLETFDIDPPFRKHPLEIAARLAMDDFNILVKDNTGEHRL
jgi:hypothetical protein